MLTCIKLFQLRYLIMGHHWLNRHKFEQTPEDSEGQRSLAHCSSWGPRVGHDWATKQQYLIIGFPGGSLVKNLSDNAEDTRDVGLTPGSGRSPRGGNGNPLRSSCLENSLDRGAWWATLQEVTKSLSTYWAYISPLLEMEERNVFSSRFLSSLNRRFNVLTHLTNTVHTEVSLLLVTVSM